MGPTRATQEASAYEKLMGSRAPDPALEMNATTGLTAPETTFDGSALAEIASRVTRPVADRQLASPRAQTEALLAVSPSAGVATTPYKALKGVDAAKGLLGKLMGRAARPQAQDAAEDALAPKRTDATRDLRHIPFGYKPGGHAPNPAKGAAARGYNPDFDLVKMDKRLAKDRMIYDFEKKHPDRYFDWADSPAPAGADDVAEYMRYTDELDDVVADELPTLAAKRGKPRDPGKPLYRRTLGDDETMYDAEDLVPGVEGPFKKSQSRADDIDFDNDPQLQARADEYAEQFPDGPGDPPSWDYDLTFPQGLQEPLPSRLGGVTKGPEKAKDALRSREYLPGEGEDGLLNFLGILKPDDFSRNIVGGGSSGPRGLADKLVRSSAWQTARGNRKPPQLGTKSRAKVAGMGIGGFMGAGALGDRINNSSEDLPANYAGDGFFDAPEGSWVNPAGPGYTGPLMIDGKAIDSDAYERLLASGYDLTEEDKDNMVPDWNYNDPRDPEADATSKGEQRIDQFAFQDRLDMVNAFTPAQLNAYVGQQPIPPFSFTDPFDIGFDSRRRYR